MRSLVRARGGRSFTSMRLRLSPVAYLNWLVFPLIFRRRWPVRATSTGYTRVPTGSSAADHRLLGHRIPDAATRSGRKVAGTLEQIFAVPTPLFVIVIGKILGSLLMGLLSFIPTNRPGLFRFSRRAAGNRSAAVRHLGWRSSPSPFS